MFDPDNFYEILRCTYSWPRASNILMYFNPNGSKLLENLNPLLKGADAHFYKNLNIGDQATFGKAILHDQEPLSFIDAANTYRQWMIKNKKHPRSVETVACLDRAADMFSYAIKSGIQPIICHSEKNSRDIEMAVDDALMIECYYWYHGMISRDWFRHWQYHPDLLPHDQSNASYRFLMYARGLDGSRKYREKFIDLMHPYKKQILYNWNRQNIVSPDHSAKIDIDDANQAAIHIVLETLFDTEKIHLTEKVFKPMVMSQPFFLLAGPGSLRYLRGYGFRTFGDFWDETYDDITDSETRMVLVEREIVKILNLSDGNFRSLYKSLIPIIEHNRQHFYSQEFQDICIREMRGNFDHALYLQKENLLVYPGGPFARLLSKIVNKNAFMSDHVKNIARDFLNSEYLLATHQQIIQKYPSLSVFYD